MKLLLAQQAKQRPDIALVSNNDTLRLAAEILESNGHWPTIDVRGARLRHWNGQNISVGRPDVADLIDRGLLNSNGHWTEYGREELAGLAGIAFPATPADQLPYTNRR